MEQRAESQRAQGAGRMQARRARREVGRDGEKIKLRKSPTRPVDELRSSQGPPSWILDSDFLLYAPCPMLYARHLAP
jgi:hypothetical protein